MGQTPHGGQGLHSEVSQRAALVGAGLPAPAHLLQGAGAVSSGGICSSGENSAEAFRPLAFGAV
eukprot:6373754-Pyramimonas_sp.AAC.1